MIYSVHQASIYLTYNGLLKITSRSLQNRHG